MFRRVLPYAIAAAFLCAPSALAATGGAGFSASSTSTARSAGPSGSDGPSGAAPSNGNATVTASSAGVTLTSQVAAVLRGHLVVSGHVDAPAGTVVEIDRRGRETSGDWAPTMHGTVASDGTFTALWEVNHIGRFDLRARVRAPRAARDATTDSPTVTITVYRVSTATVYGPGLYGNGTACGQTLTPDTIGVASRTLPCGTRVSLLYHGRTLLVPVIDRGPFTQGVDWDLTSATARSLGIPGTVRLGAVSVPGR